MSSTHSEREQVADLVSKLIVDDQFRRDFDADPRAAISASGITLSAQATDKIVQTAQLVPDVMAHMEGSDEISKLFFFAKVTDD